MVQFKSWEDFNLLLKNHAICSCLNCTGYHSDFKSPQFVCMRTLSPVRLDILHLCAEWQDNDGHILQDMIDDGVGENNWNFPVEVAEKIDELGEASYEEILEVIENYEEVKEQESN